MSARTIDEEKSYRDPQEINEYIKVDICVCSNVQSLLKFHAFLPIKVYMTCYSLILTEFYRK